MDKNWSGSGIQKWWRRKSIRDQIFLSMLLITFLATGLLGNASYRVATSAIEENYRISYDSTLKNSSKVLNMNLKNVTEEARSFLIRTDLQHVLKSSRSYGGTGFSTEDQKILKRVSENLTNYQTWVNSVVFMDLHRHHYQLNNVNRGTYDFYRYYAEHDFLEEDWSQKAREAEGKEVFFMGNVIKGISDSGFSMAKYLVDPSTGEPMGYLVVNLSKKLLARSFVMSGEGAKTSSYIIADEKSPKSSWYFTGEDGEKGDILREYVSGETKNQKYIFTVVKNDITGWNLVNAIAKNKLSSESKRILGLVILCGAGIILLCFVLARVISQNITSPLKQLEDIISRVGEGERHITEEFDYSEVGRLGRKFKEMVNTNLELSEHLMSVKLNEREAELLLLQSQINPHFLYNTLDSLYFVAIMHGDDQMADMVMALSDNFKLALNNGNKYISVADSVKWMQGYMKLQNLRFNNRFEFFVDIKREILQRKTISFILQPFIENAMYHGLEPKIGRGKISLLGWQEGNDMVFVIEDNGVGIDDLSVLEKGYGIRNVKERILLNYGEKYGVTIESERGKGTRVKILVPIE